MFPWLLAIAAVFAYRYFKSRGSIPVIAPATVPVILNGVCLTAGFVYLVSFNPTARFFSVASSILSSFIIIYTNYGIPRISRQAIKQPLQEYMTRCMSGAEFPFLFFVLMFTNDYASQVGGGVVPFGVADYLTVLLMVRRSAWFLGSHGAKAWSSKPVWEKIGMPFWAALRSREASIMSGVNLVEILVGFWLVLLSLTPARQLMNTFVYWTFLRIKYMAPRSRASHLAAWRTIDIKTRWMRKSVPVVEKPVGYMVNWFNQGI
jgi:hypothetical protein